MSAKSAQSRRDVFALFLTAPLLMAQSKPELKTRVTPFESLKAVPGNKHTTWPVMDGQTFSGDHLEVHETRLEPGAMPHAPHRHIHEEMFLIRNGTVTLTVNQQSTQVGPGGVAFIHSGELHGIQNTGSDPAEYFVVALGTDTPAKPAEASAPKRTI